MDSPRPVSSFHLKFYRQPWKWKRPSSTTSSDTLASLNSHQFISRVWHGFFKLLRVSVNLSSGYHPQMNGQTERKIQEIGCYLQAYCHNHQPSWSQYLPWAKYAQNSLRHESTRLILFHCILGYQPPLFLWTGEPSEVPFVDHWVRESMGISACSSAVDSLSPENSGTYPSSRCASSPSGGQSLAFHPRYLPATHLQEAEPALHRSLHHLVAD